MVRLGSIATAIPTMVLAMSLRGPAAPATAGVNPAAKTAAQTQRQTPRQPQDIPPVKPQEPTPVEPSPQVSSMARMYGAYWGVGNGITSTLLLKNKDQQNSVAAHITLFSAAGQQTTYVQLGPGATSRLNLADIVRPAGNSIQSGGLAVDSTGVLSGHVMVEGPQSSSFNLALQGGYRYDSENALYAPWWLPDDGSDGSITVFNSSGQNVAVTPSVSVAGGEEQSRTAFTLAPLASTTIGLRSLMGKNNGSGGNLTGTVTLRYSGPSHALLPILRLTNSSTGFSLTPGFNARHQQSASQQVTWQYPEVSLIADSVSGTLPKTQALTAYALLTNGTTSSLSPRMTALYAAGNGKTLLKIDLPVASLMPSETRLVNLSQLLTDASISAGVSHFALTVTHEGSPGDLAISIFSATEGNDQVVASAGTTQAADVIDSSYWKLGAPEVVPKVLNKNKVAALAQVTMYYQTSTGLESYMLPLIVVPGSRTQPLGLREIMNSHIADAEGNKVPSGISAGLITLTLVDGIGDSSVPSADSGVECQTDCNAQPVRRPGLGAPLPSRSASAIQPTMPTSGVQFFSSGCPPVITEIDPNSGDLGTTDLNVVIIGDGFEDGDIIDVTGGITADSPAVSPDGTTMSTTFTIPSDALTGDQTVTVTGFDGTSNEVTFTVNTPHAPILENVDPNTAAPGTQNLSVLIDMGLVGKFLDGDTINVTGGITATYNPGDISPDGVQVNATFNIPACTSGEQQVTVTDVLGQTSDAVPFTVNPLPAPAITGISPTTLNAGDPTTTVTIQGTNIGCNMVVTSSDSFISFGQATFTDETGTSIQVPATVDPNDPGGSVQVFVTTSADSGGGFARIALPKAGITVSPGGAKPAGTQAKPPGASTGKPGIPNQPAGGSSKTGRPNQGSVKSPTKPGPIGFFTTGGGGTSNGATITVQPLPAPDPQIVVGTDATACNGSPANLAANGTITPVLAGQKIQVVGCINGIDPRLTVTNESWSDPTGVAVAGFTNGNGASPDTTGGHSATISSTICLIPTSANPDPPCPLLSFYWVCPSLGVGACEYPGNVAPTGNVQVTFQYQLQRGDTHSATAQFFLNGPTNANVTSGVVPVIVTSATSPVGLRLMFGNPPLSFGITFKPVATLPNGRGASATFQWVQLLTADTQKRLQGDPNQPVVACTMNPAPSGNFLDTVYPYGFPNAQPPSTTDSPSSFPLGAFNESESTRSFNARMFLMWDPALRTDGQQCVPDKEVDGANGPVKQPGDCDSIPIPIGYVDWHWSGDAINTLDTTTPPRDTQGWRAGAPPGQPGCGNPDAAGAGPTLTHNAFLFPDWPRTKAPGLQDYTCH